MRGLLGSIGCLLLVGCEPPDDIVVPSDSGGSLSDSIASSRGLYVAFDADPALPGPVRTDLIVTSATFHLARVQAIGDAGGDERNDLDLIWEAGFPVPPPIALTEAPAGIYFKVTLDLDNGLDDAYEITGTCKVGGIVRMFAIRDRDNLRIQIYDFNATLQPGRDVTLGINVDLENALDAINYGSLNDDNGTLVLETGDSQMDEFRDKLQNAFKRGS